MVCENLFIPQHAIATVDWHARLNEGEMSWILGMMVKHEWDLHVSLSDTFSLKHTWHKTWDYDARRGSQSHSCKVLASSTV